MICLGLPQLPSCFWNALLLPTCIAPSVATLPQGWTSISEARSVTTYTTKGYPKAVPFYPLLASRFYLSRGGSISYRALFLSRLQRVSLFGGYHLEGGLRPFFWCVCLDFRHGCVCRSRLSLHGCGNESHFLSGGHGKEIFLIQPYTIDGLLFGKKSVRSV